MQKHWQVVKLSLFRKVIPLGGHLCNVLCNSNKTWIETLIFLQSPAKTHYNYIFKNNIQKWCKQYYNVFSMIKLCYKFFMLIYIRMCKASLGRPYWAFLLIRFNSVNINIFASYDMDSHYTFIHLADATCNMHPQRLSSSVQWAVITAEQTRVRCTRERKCIFRFYDTWILVLKLS